MSRLWRAFSVFLATLAFLLCGTFRGHSASSIVAWGDNFYGQTNVPAGLSQVVALAGSGSHSLALQRNGTVVAWGWNSYGQTSVPGDLSDVIAIAAGGSHSLALKADGTVVAWGWNFYGQTNVPLALGEVAGVAGGGSHTLALLSNGTVVAWGNNDNGQASVPLGLANVVAVAGGGWHSLALKANGSIVAWGYNGYGQTSVPVDLTNVVAIAAGAVHSAALTAQGRVVVWGNNDYGQHEVPVNLGTVVGIACGAYHVLALTPDGRVVAWGNNFSGQTNVPSGLSGVVAIADRSAALVGDGPPYLTTPLVDRAGAMGQPVQFRIAATGVWPLRYQWCFNGEIKPGETNSFLWMENAQASLAGLYSVIASNAFGVVTSRAARLTVSPLLLEVAPESQATWRGGVARFSAFAEGAGPLSYQWQWEGQNISDDARRLGCTSANLLLTNVLVGDAGNYRIYASNTFGMVTSKVAQLLVTNRPPTILQQPVSRIVDASSNAYFSVLVTSPYAYSAQWWFNGATVTGAVSTQLTLINVWTNQAGNYWCVVSNMDGAATSAVATLQVDVHPPTILRDPQSRTNFTGTSIMLQFTFGGTPPFYCQWQRDGADIPGATNYILGLTLLNTNQTGDYRVIVGNYFGLATSAVARVTVLLPPPVLTWPHQAVFEVDWGTPLDFGASASGGGPFFWQWQRDGLDLPGATNASFHIFFTTTNHVGDYRVIVRNAGGAATSTVSTLVVLLRPPLIQQQPQHKTVDLGASAQFGAAIVGARPLSFQWLHNGQIIPGASSYSYTILSVTLAHQGDYQIVASNFLGVVTSAVARLVVRLNPPQITQQPPLGVSYDWGTTALFAVVATGTPPVFYQWQFQGTNIPGATDATYARANITSNDAGGYRALVSNVAGAATSQVCTLTVLIRPPLITQEPQSKTVDAGSSTSFAVTAAGAQPIFYQWRFNGQNLGGATNSSLYFPEVRPDQQGDYQVVASNFVGMATSVVARLTVQVYPPQIEIQPSGGATDWGANALFQVKALGTRPFSYQWWHDNQAIPDATNDLYYIASATSNDAGGYRVVITNIAGAITSSVAMLEVWVSPPSFTTQPISQIVDADWDAVCFVAVAHGAPPPDLHWQFNEQDIPGANSASLCLYGVSSNQAGGYRLVASNFVGMATSEVAVLSVRYRAPEILGAYPASLSVLADTFVFFDCTVAGGPKPALLWFHNGQPMAGETNSWIYFAASSTNQAGDYWLIATNIFGSATSQVATLTIQTIAPAFLTQPVSQGVVAGNSVQFIGSALGNPAPAYQWQLNGQPVPGATNPVFYIGEATTNLAGVYAVVASNEAGSVTSRVAQLVVSLPGPLDRWQWRRPLPQGNDLLCAAYGNGIFTALGRSGTRIRSVDGGATWQTHSQGNADINCVTYGNGVFVAIGKVWTGYEWWSRVQVSSNAIDWRDYELEPPWGGLVQDVAFGNGRFVAVTDQGHALVSTNGSEWTTTGERIFSFGPLPPMFSSILRRIVFGQNKFVALGGFALISSPEGRTWPIAVSTNGEQWSIINVATPGTCADLTFGNGTFVIAGNVSTNSSNQAFALSSSNALDWTAALMPVYSHVSAVAFGAGRFTVVSDANLNVCLISPNGLNWTSQPLGVTNQFYALAASDSTVVAVGDQGSIVTSSNAVDWVVRNPGSPVNLRSVARVPGKYIAVGNEGLLLTSTDGRSWTRQAALVNSNLRGIAYGNSRIVVVGERATNGVFALSSTDGETWLPAEVSTGLDFYAVAFGDGIFVAVGDNGLIATSLDGLDWTPCYSGTTARLNAVAFNGSRYVAVGKRGTILSSTNGLFWESEESPVAHFLQGIAYGNGRFVGAGEDGQLVISTNGVNWTGVSGADSPFTTGIEDIQFASGQFLAVGADGYLASSPDGVIWTPHRLFCQNTLRYTTYAGGYVLAIGNNETILQSDFFGAPVLQVRGLLSGEQFEFGIEAEVGNTHRLQFSEDLENWEDVLTFRNTRVLTIFMDQEMRFWPRGFYRVVSP